MSTGSAHLYRNLRIGRVVNLLWVGLLACTSPQNHISTQSADGIENGAAVGEHSSLSYSTVLLIKTLATGTQFSCTAVVLANDIVLTAGHCVSEDNTDHLVAPSSVMVYDAFHGDQGIAASALRTPMGYLEHLKRQDQAEPTSFFTEGYDIALVQLSSPLPAPYRAVEIDSEFSDLWQEHLQIAGYGNDAEDDSNPGPLLSGTIKLDANRKNSDAVFNSFDNQDQGVSRIVPGLTVNQPYARMIEYQKATPGDAGLQPGDSGGPVFYERFRRIHLVAINVELGLDKSQWEDAVWLSGENLHFLTENFQELTHQPLLKTLPLPEDKDPEGFLFQFKILGFTSTNQDLDLSSLVAIDNGKQDPVARYYFLLSTKDGANPCEELNTGPEGLHLFNMSLPKYGDTTTPVATDFLSLVNHNNHLDALAVDEARVISDGHEMQIVALTSDGFVGARVPIRVCPP